MSKQYYNIDSLIIYITHHKFNYSYTQIAPSTTCQCKICKLSSLLCTFAYICHQCKQSFCIIHSIEHFIIFQNCALHRFQINCDSDTIQIHNDFPPFSEKQVSQIAINLAKSNIVIKSEKYTYINHNVVNAYIRFIKASNIKSIRNAIIKDLRCYAIGEEEMMLIIESLKINKTLKSISKVITRFV